MSSNSEEDEFHIDPRINEETRTFITNMFRVIRPRAWIENDVEQTRAMEYAGACMNLAAFDKDNLVIDEFFVTNTTDGHEIRVKSIAPKETRSNTPITVFFHGGGFVFGSTTTHLITVAKLALLTKTRWLSVEYRLAPEHKFRAMMSDCTSVVEWALANKEMLSSNKDANVGVCGDSAGGHLSALVAPRFKQALAYQILIYPVIDFARQFESDRHFVDECFIIIPEMMDYFKHSAFGDLTSEERNSALVSPILNDDLDGLADCLLVAAELDPLRDHSIAYSHKLRAKNINVQLHIVKGTVHGFFNNSQTCVNAFAECAEKIQEFLKNF